MVVQHTLSSVIHGYRRHARITKTEWLRILAISIVFGFIFSFTLWNDPDHPEVFNAVFGIFHWALYTLFSALGLLAMHLPMRIMAYRMGYHMELQQWNLGIIMNLFICMLSNGVFIFLTPPGAGITTKINERIGYFSPGPQHREFGYLVFWGMFGTILYAVLLKLLLPFNLASDLIFVGLLISIWSFFPLDLIFKIFDKKTPISNGTYFILGMQTFIVFGVAFYLISLFSIYFLPKLWAIIIPLLLAVIVYIIYYVFVMSNGKDRKGNVTSRGLWNQ